MIKAVLLDLDDTLLINPNDAFAMNFIGAWEAFATERLGLLNTGRHVYDAVQEAIDNKDPLRTNLDVSVSVMAAAWRLSESEVLALFEAFYAEAYPQLKRLTTPQAVAPSLVDSLRGMGYRVVIATNPVYGADAIAQRLAWAGLPADYNHYDFVTHIENTHFTKPHPQYYEEILGRLGIANDEALMVGDSWTHDMVPAEQAGLNTYWVRNDNAQQGSDAAQPNGQGTLQDFAFSVCNQGWLDTLQPRPLRHEMIVPRLVGNVAALFGLINDANPNHWPQRPDPNEWSPLEAVCHLCDNERLVQRPRLQRIAREENPFISTPQSPPGPGMIPCKDQNHAESAEKFFIERQETIAFLESLLPEAWDRPARHSIFGPTTLLEMADFTARHDRLHLEQICQTIGRCI